MQVQVIYQKCDQSTNASCNCAVAVKSGDDVFVLDKCRRKGQTGQITASAIVYANGNLTKGTRVFRKDGGLRYDVRQHFYRDNSIMKGYIPKWYICFKKSFKFIQM